MTLQKISNVLFFTFSVDVVQDSNRAEVEKTFAPVFLRSKLLAPHQLGQLFVFMIANVSQLWQLPDDVVDLIELRVGSMPDCCALDKASFGEEIIIFYIFHRFITK